MTCVRACKLMYIRYQNFVIQGQTRHSNNEGQDLIRFHDRSCCVCESDGDIQQCYCLVQREGVIVKRLLLDEQPILYL